jgi:hypothetical protein
MFTILAVIIILFDRVETFRDFMLSNIDWALANTGVISAVLLGVAVILFGLSYLLSQRVYAKRDF